MLECFYFLLGRRYVAYFKKQLAEKFTSGWLVFWDIDLGDVSSDESAILVSLVLSWVLVSTYSIHNQSL